ncbi:MAG: hypothetical protein EXX96DRAFT_562496 [Benjaminiella poitrasii]|nr:MAG: hypothetical protein EXX96DRAFT_562496 [Benjaminiella poitrasii]
MKFTVVTVLTAIVSAVYAQTTAVPNAGIAVNLPALGQVINAGSSFTITWTVDAASTSNTINSIALMKGGSANLESYIANILAAPIPVNPPSYNWNVPATIETNPSYVLAFAGSNGATTYSTYFTIMGAAPGTNTTVPSTSASSVAPAASSGAVLPANSTTNGNKNSTTGATTTPTSGASHVKAGMIGAAGVAVAALLL